jgi:ELP3 family radical SAM enzyme/protein acetyltransferase
MNCYYCPFEKDEQQIPTQPRSYLSTEPGNKRATQNKHHPVGQMFDRIFQLEEMGHIPNSFLQDKYLGAKLEIIISGGTFNFYPHDYIIWFVTCMYYSANIYYDYRKNNKFTREMYSLQEEQIINQNTHLRIIGLTIETRPDYLIHNDDKFFYLKFFRQLGITRIQIGIQHTNNKILKYINRQCTNEQNKSAIKLLKDNGFKVDIHIMLDLPSSSPQEDKNMLTLILNDTDYEADQWKIYPTEVTNFTVIKKWYDEGKYIPYSEQNSGQKLIDVIIHAKKLMKPWIRINRVIRDIPSQSIEGGINCPQMRDIVEKHMNSIGLYCKCIRCREIKLEHIPDNNIKLIIRHYISSGSDEFFISYESLDEKKLIAFLRLRLNKNFNNTMHELKNFAFIRELHVLGHHTTIGTTGSSIQHKGYGTKLIQKAEEIAKQHNYKGISVISGVGVREYYSKKGYILSNNNMVKIFNHNYYHKYKSYIITIIVILLSLWIIYN